MKVFVQVAESGSFSGAAEALGRTQSQVSKLVRALEDQLNATLFMRTTRKITLTKEAHRLLPHARSLMDRYRETVESVHGERAEPSGHIRFLTSDGLGRSLFLPYLPNFLARYPHISIEHIVTDRKIDLVENNIDLALRMGDLKDSSYKARRIGLARRVTVATPGYLEAQGTPEQPQDLMHHNCIRFTRIAEYVDTGDAWMFRHRQSGKRLPIAVNGSYASDNSSTVKQAALLGVGIYQGPDWLFREELAAGTMVEILSDYEIDPYPIYLIYPPVDYLPLRLKTMMDYLANEFSLNPWVAV